MDRHVWVLCQALDCPCYSKQFWLDQWPEPVARVMGQGAGSWPNKVAHDMGGGGESGIGPEGGKVSGGKWGRWMDGFWSWRPGAVEGDAHESRWWGARAAGDRCARPNQ